MLLFLLTLAAILMGGWVTAIISGIGDAGKVNLIRLEQENFIMVTLSFFFQSAMLQGHIACHHKD